MLFRSALGVRQLQLIDFDVVEPTNVTTQGYYDGDVSVPKVTATAQTIHQIDPTITVTTILDRFRPRHETGTVLFCCVDSIETRAAIWRSVNGLLQFWCDGRMLGEVIRLLSVTDTVGGDYYPSSLFMATEAQASRCTARSTIYTANIAAGMMLHQFTRWLRGLAVESDVTLNLLASELTVE